MDQPGHRAPLRFVSGSGENGAGPVGAREVDYTVVPAAVRFEGRTLQGETARTYHLPEESATCRQSS